MRLVIRRKSIKFGYGDSHCVAQLIVNVLAVVDIWAYLSGSKYMCIGFVLLHLLVYLRVLVYQ